MELTQRISAAKPDAAPAPVVDPFAEVKDKIHKAVISGLGPQLFNAETDPATLRGRVHGDIDVHLDQESGIARTDRERIAREIADDILGHGPIERLLEDDTITEIMVNGPFEVWIERQGKLYHTAHASTTTGTCDASSPRWSPRSAGASTRHAQWWTRACPTAAASMPFPSAVVVGSAPHHPEVPQAAAHCRGPGTAGHADA